MTLNILIADDNQIFRKGLTSLINQLSDYEIVSEAVNGREAVWLAKKLSPDIVIMDINMPELNGLDAARQIRSDSSEIKIIALSMCSDLRFIREMFKSGCNGHVVKNCVSHELPIAINTVMKGKVYLSHDIIEPLVKDIICSVEPPISPVDLISLREWEILKLVTEGNSSRKIAALMNLSSASIESHRKNIMDKLEIYALTELTRCHSSGHYHFGGC